MMLSHRAVFLAIGVIAQKLAATGGSDPAANGLSTGTCAPASLPPLLALPRVRMTVELAFALKRTRTHRRTKPPIKEAYKTV